MKYKIELPNGHRSCNISLKTKTKYIEKKVIQMTDRGEDGGYDARCEDNYLTFWEAT